MMRRPSVGAGRAKKEGREFMARIFRRGNDG
jgi:hypothetical protein